MNVSNRIGEKRSESRNSVYGEFDLTRK